MAGATRGLGSQHPLLGRGLEKVLPKAQMTCKCRMKQESGWSVLEWLPLTIAASSIRLQARLLSQPADPAGAPALPGGCWLLHQHQLSRHVPARPQAGPHNLLRLLSILAL